MRKGGHSRFSWLKLLVSLLVVASVIGIGIAGYLAFTHQLPPLVGAISFIVIVGLFIWFITVLRKPSMHYRAPSFILIFLSLVGITLVCAFAGVEPLVTYKDTMISAFTSATSPSAKTATPIVVAKVVENWKIQLNSSNWSGSTLNVNLTITNLGLRRNFGYAGMDVGPELAVIDSTGKLVEPWVPQPDYRRGVIITLPSYTKEFYPNESWTGNLKFEMSPYSGKTNLYITRYYHSSKYLLFDLGEP